MNTYKVRVHLRKQMWVFILQARDIVNAENIVDLITSDMDFFALEIH